MAPRPSGRLLFGSEVLPQVLDLLFGQPRRTFGYKEISEALASPSPETLYRALNRAVELGVVRRESKGGRYGAYAADISSPMYRDLRRILSHLNLGRSAGAYQPENLAALAERLRHEAAASPDAGPSNVASLWIHQFIDDFEGARRSDKRKLLEPEPPRTGSPILDVYLAALAEHLAGRAGLPAPGWTEDPDRFLKRWWLEGEVASARPTALATSPAAFRRRGVFVDARSLSRV